MSHLRARLLALAMLGGCTLLLAAQLPASAIDVGGGSSPVTGNATWFSGLGSPYGGSGLPQANLDRSATTAPGRTTGRRTSRSAGTAPG